MNHPPQKIILAPVITEKTTKLKESDSLLCFRVAIDANKIEIKRAIEAIFSVKVATVRTAQVRGKMKRMGRFEGKRANWKKAYVKLRPGEKMIEYFEGV